MEKFTEYVCTSLPAMNEWPSLIRCPHCRICGEPKHQRIEDMHSGRQNYTSHGNTAPCATLPPPPAPPPVLASMIWESGPRCPKRRNKSSSVSMWTPSTTPRLEEVHCPGQCHSGENQAPERNCWSSLHLAPPPPCPAMASKSPWRVTLVATGHQHVWQRWKGGGGKD